MNNQELQFVLAPIQSMSGGDALSRDPVVAAEYARVLRDHGVGIARKAAERACEGLTWRPVPGEVRRALDEVVLEAAKEMIRDSMRIAAEGYTTEQFDHHGQLVALGRYADAKEFGHSIYREFWDMDAHQPLDDPLALARLLPAWKEIEASPPDSSGIRGLVSGLLDRFKRIGGVK